MTIQQQLESIRQAAKAASAATSQAQLARQARIHPVTLSRFLNRKAGLSIPALDRLAKVINGHHS